MPSSHSAAVTALSTGIALEQGLDSPLFAVAAIFAVITMFDATGVRRHAGEQATVINKLVIDFNRFVSEAKDFQKAEEKEKQKKLKELLGHQPIEVFFGGVTQYCADIDFRLFLYKNASADAEAFLFFYRFVLISEHLQRLCFVQLYKFVLSHCAVPFLIM